MLKIERFARIEEELKKKGSLEIPSLSQMLGCSEETVRRDLRELESVGKLNRIRGGAYLSDKYDKTYASPLRKTLYQQEKSQMSQKAMEFIHDRDVLFLDSSTTCLTLVGLLLNSKLSLTIVTNSMMICSLCTEPNSHINLICLGGSLRARTLSFVGYHTTDILSTYYADCAFISSPKATLSEGLSTTISTKPACGNPCSSTRGGAFSLWTIPNSMKAPISASMAWSWWTRSLPTRPSPQNGPPFVSPRTST